MVAKYGGRLDDRKEYMKCLGIMAVPFVCIMTQPDLGTGLVYMFIAAAITAGFYNADKCCCATRV